MVVQPLLCPSCTCDWLLCIQIKQEAACGRVDGLLDQIAALQDEVSSLQVSNVPSTVASCQEVHARWHVCIPMNPVSFQRHSSMLV